MVILTRFNVTRTCRGQSRCNVITSLACRDVVALLAHHDAACQTCAECQEVRSGLLGHFAASLRSQLVKDRMGTHLILGHFWNYIYLSFLFTLYVLLSFEDHTTEIYTISLNNDIFPSDTVVKWFLKTQLQYEKLHSKAKISCQQFLRIPY